MAGDRKLASDALRGTDVPLLLVESALGRRAPSLKEDSVAAKEEAQGLLIGSSLASTLDEDGGDDVYKEGGAPETEDRVLIDAVGDWRTIVTPERSRDSAGDDSSVAMKVAGGCAASSAGKLGDPR